ncbi:leukocyte receptor cluster member 9 isoform X2 [Dunckerocampus dactyliophorus]|uniref:leukocyte receptor cluster member 9 isoform X2 n=1 Tax=Dunckerocampus dactyliophorus TaxID=161453 RepID=UPI0024052A69|nr:leukocyte receptor cluster member 9 isoform X2 [Dunckerocampus dactyliophorus]
MGVKDSTQLEAVKSKDEEGPNVCRFFLKGKCHFGPRCRMSHQSAQLICEVTSSSVESSMAIADAILLEDQEAEQEEEKQKKKKGDRNKASKPKEKAAKDDVNKKPRMRTADDIISRIVWDPSVDASQFIVGYVDRFLGVLERPFSEFNWDTNPCDCDYATELALPRHRIQYFTYRGHRVWDRHSRTDRVFGSTGQSLAPPFGGEEEVEGKETQPEDQEQQGKVTLGHGQATREEPPAVNGQGMDCTTTESAHLEDETHPSDSAQASLEWACVVEEAANSLTASADREGPLVQEERTAEGEESFESQDNSTPSASLGQRSENRGGRPPKKKPTHFITFRANTPAILTCFQQLQEEITALLPSSAPHWQASSRLHVTLCLLVLPGPAEVAAAGEILRQFAHMDRNPPVAVMFPVKLKHFNGRVMYLSPQPQLHLQQLNNGLQEAYRNKGWLHRNSYNPRYHLTLAKVKDKEGERTFNDVGDLKVGKGLNFGRLPVNTLHLCVMGSARVDGFYETLCTVTLR